MQATPSGRARQETETETENDRFSISRKPTDRRFLSKVGFGFRVLMVFSLIWHLYSSVAQSSKNIRDMSDQPRNSHDLFFKFP
jgi:hypothetical protein